MKAYMLVVYFFLIISITAQTTQYKFILDSEIAIKASGVEQKVKSLTRIDYTWKRNGVRRDLFFDLTRVQVSVDGKENINVDQSAKSTVNIANGKKTVTLAKDDPSIKKVLKDSFEEALLFVITDSSNKVKSRKVIAKPGAQLIVEQGVIESALLFHAPYMKLENAWKNNTKMSTGNGGYVIGDLNYTKSKIDKATVEVKGTLSAEKIVMPNGIQIVNAAYKVKGKQHFDIKTSTWTSGTLMVEVSFKMIMNGKDLGAVKGLIIATVEQLR